MSSGSPFVESVAVRGAGRPKKGGGNKPPPKERRGGQIPPRHFHVQRLDIAPPRRDPPRSSRGRPQPLPAETDETHSIESDILDADMTPRDLVWALQNL